MNALPGSPAPLSKLAQAILDTLRAASAKSLAPADLARMLAAEGGEAKEWRNLLAPVRQTGLALARAGHIVVLRKGHPVTPDAARGVIRLALPSEAAEPLAPDGAAPPSSPPSDF